MNRKPLYDSFIHVEQIGRGKGCRFIALDKSGNLHTWGGGESLAILEDMPKIKQIHTTHRGYYALDYEGRVHCIEHPLQEKGTDSSRIMNSQEINKLYEAIQNCTLKDNYATLSYFSVRGFPRPAEIPFPASLPPIKKLYSDSSHKNSNNKFSFLEGGDAILAIDFQGKLHYWGRSKYLFMKTEFDSPIINVYHSTWPSLDLSIVKSLDQIIAVLEDGKKEIVAYYAKLRPWGVY